MIILADIVSSTVWLVATLMILADKVSTTILFNGHHDNTGCHGINHNVFYWPPTPNNKTAERKYSAVHVLIACLLASLITLSDMVSTTILFDKLLQQIVFIILYLCQSSPSMLIDTLGRGSMVNFNFTRRRVSSSL